MRLKTLLLALLPAAVSTAQPEAQKPEAGQTYYIYNLGGAGYLYDSGGTPVLFSAGTPVTLSEADATAGTFYMDVSAGRLSVTPFSGISTDGGGTYDQWSFTPVEGSDDIYSISYRMKEGNTFPFLYADATEAGALKTQPYAPSDGYTAGEWIFVAEGDYADNTVTLDENSNTYSAPAGTGMTVTLKRTFSPGCWNTFCVPFDIDAARLRSAFGEDVRLAEYTGCDGTRLVFSVSENAEAGRPYFIYIGASHETPAGGYVFTGVNSFAEKPTPVTHDAVTFTGCFTAVTAPAGSYVISRNTLYHTQDAMTVKGFRGVISTSDASGKLSGWSLDDGTDGIGGVTTDSGNAGGDIYTIGGQKTGLGASDTKDMPEGVYVVKGKKIVIK